MSPLVQDMASIARELEKTLLTESRRDNIVQILRDLEVDSKVLSTELSGLARMSGRIEESIRGLRLSLQEQELEES